MSYIMKYKIAYILVNKISELIFQISYFTEGYKITQHATESNILLATESILRKATVNREIRLSNGR